MVEKKNGRVKSHQKEWNEEVARTTPVRIKMIEIIQLSFPLLIDTIIFMLFHELSKTRCTIVITDYFILFRLRNLALF